MNKKEIVCLLIVFLFSISMFSTMFATTLEEVEKMEAFIDGILVNQLDKNNIIGATISIVQDGAIILEKGYGFADLEQRIPVEPKTTIFRAGSISKLFTWTAVMQLVEQGKLDLNADVNKYLNFTLPADVKYNRAKPEPIRLKHLLTHTSGFEDRTEGLLVICPDKMLSLEKYLRQHMPSRIFPAGKTLAYSNYGTSLAGYIVERVSGQSFEEYIEEFIFQPLKMKYSTFQQPLLEEFSANMTDAYNYIDGKYYKGGFEIFTAPAGGLSTTARDMAHFMIAHLQKGIFNDRRILTADTTDNMHCTQFTHHPKIDGMTYGFIEKKINGKRVINHGGDTPLFHSGMYLLPEHNLGFFVSYSGGDYIQRERLFQSFMNRYFPEDYSLVPEPPEDTHIRSKEYLGEYYVNRSSFTTWEKVLVLFDSVRVNMTQEGYLSANLYGETKYFVEIEPGVYQNINNNGTVLVNTIFFQKGPNGRNLMAVDGPVSYSQVPWYGNRLFIFTLILFSLIMIMVSLMGCGISYMRSLIKREKRNLSKTKTFARRVAILYCLLTIFYFIGLVTILSDIVPAYGVPKIVFGITTEMSLIFNLPLFIVILVITMFVFTFLAWWKGYWNLVFRFYYSLLTLSAFGLLWVLSYSNLL